MERITAPKGSIEKIAKAMNCTTRAVYIALKGDSSSDLAKRIRYVAIKEYGCRELSDVTCEHDTASGAITHRYGSLVTMRTLYGSGIPVTIITVAGNRVPTPNPGDTIADLLENMLYCHRVYQEIK